MRAPVPASLPLAGAARAPAIAAAAAFVLIPVAAALLVVEGLSHPVYFAAAGGAALVFVAMREGLRRLGPLGLGLAGISLAILLGQISAVSVGGQSGRLLWADAVLGVVVAGALIRSRGALELPRAPFLSALGLFVTWCAFTLIAARDALTGIAELKEWIVAALVTVAALRYADRHDRARTLVAIVALTGGLIGAWMIATALLSPLGIVLAVLLKKVDLPWGRTNFLAGLLVLALPLTLGLLGSSTGARGRVAWAALLLAQAGGILVSASKGGIVALAAALVVACVSGGRAWRAAGVAALALFGIGAALFAFGPLQEVVRYRLQESAVDYSVGERMDLYGLAWDSFLHSPVWGLGLNNFSVASNHLTGVDTVPHNFQLGFLAELGGVGLFLAFAWVLAFGRDAWRAQRGQGRDRALGVGVWAAFVGFAIHNQFESTIYGEQFKILLVMVAAAAHRLAAPESGACNANRTI